MEISILFDFSVTEIIIMSLIGFSIHFIYRRVFKDE
jgi:hypothetical protein